ncbi:AAA family ATPase [Enterobacter hormaechei]
MIKWQIETSLFNLKATLPNEYPNMIKSLNYFFSDKRIDSEIFQVHVNRLFYQMEGNIRLMSKFWRTSNTYYVIYNPTLAKPGGIVLIDEPDLHLHPSVIAPLLAAIENIVTNKKGQLILTSHSTEVWQRYEKFGSRIDLLLLKESVNVEN